MAATICLSAGLPTGASLGVTPIFSMRSTAEQADRALPNNVAVKNLNRKLRMGILFAGGDLGGCAVGQGTGGAYGAGGGDDGADHAEGSGILHRDGIADAALAHRSAHRGQTHPWCFEGHGDGL